MAEFDLGEQLILEQDMDLQLTGEEIREYAREIGIDPDSEPELLWLAIEGLTVPLPPNWIACQDPVKGLYYFNSKTSESTWHHPNDMLYSQLVIQERQALHAGTARGTAAGTAPKMEKDKKQKKEKRVTKKEALKTPEVLSSASRTQQPLLGNLPPLRGMTNTGRSPLPGIAPTQQKSLGSFGGLEPVQMSLGGSQRFGASSPCRTRKEEKVPLSRNKMDYADDDMSDESISVSEKDLLDQSISVSEVSGAIEDSEETSQPSNERINIKLDSHQSGPPSLIRPLKPAKCQSQSYESSSDEDAKLRAGRFIKSKKKEEIVQSSSDESGPLKNLRLTSELPACEVKKESEADTDPVGPSRFIFKKVDTKQFFYEEEDVEEGEGEEKEEEEEQGEEEEADGHLLEEEELEREEEEEKKLLIMEKEKIIGILCEELGREEEEEKELLMMEKEKRMGLLREELEREEEKEKKLLMMEKEKRMGIVREELWREEEEEKKQVIWEKEKRMDNLKEKLERERNEEEKKLKDESEQSLRALQESLLSNRSEEEAKLNAESECTLKKLRESAQGEKERQQQKLREESQVTLKEEQAAERERLEAQKRQDFQRLRAEFEEELQSEKRRLQKQMEENLEPVKKELTTILDDHKRQMDQLREDHEREIINIRRQYQDEEAAFKNSLLADVQERERLQDSHTVKREKLRSVLDAQIQEAQLTHPDKESELQDLTTKTVLKAKDLKSQEGMLQTEVTALERKRKKLGEEVDEVDRPVEALPQLVQERDKLKHELERMKEENHQVRGLLQRALGERDGARMEEERLRKDRDKAMQESRRAKMERDKAMETDRRAQLKEKPREEEDTSIEESMRVKMEEDRLRTRRDKAIEESRRAIKEKERLREEKNTAMEGSTRARMEKEQLETKVAQLQAKYDHLSDRISRIEQGEAVSASPIAEPKQDRDRAEKAEETGPSWDNRDSSLHVENLGIPPLSPVHESHSGTDNSLLSTSTPVTPQMHTMDARTFAPPPSVRLSGSPWNAVPQGSSTALPRFSTPINCRLRPLEDHINSPCSLAFPGAVMNPILSSSRRSTSAYPSYTPASEYSRNLRPTEKTVDKDGQRVQGTIASIKKWLQMHQNDTNIHPFTLCQSTKKSVVQLCLDKNQINVCQY